MKTATLAGLLAALLGAFLGLWLLRWVVGTIAFALQFVLIVGGVLVAAYVLQQLWSGWRRAA